MENSAHENAPKQAADFAQIQTHEKKALCRLDACIFANGFKQVSFYLRFFARLVLSARRWTQLHPAPIES
jgi:hypothetical protein